MLSNTFMMLMFHENLKQKIVNIPLQYEHLEEHLLDKQVLYLLRYQMESQELIFQEISLVTLCNKYELNSQKIHHIISLEHLSPDIKVSEISKYE